MTTPHTRPSALAPFAEERVRRLEWLVKLARGARTGVPACTCSPRQSSRLSLKTQTRSFEIDCMGRFYYRPKVVEQAACERGLPPPPISQGRFRVLDFLAGDA